MRVSPGHTEANGQSSLTARFVRPRCFSGRMMSARGIVWMLVLAGIATGGCAAAAATTPGHRATYHVEPQPPRGSCHARGSGQSALPDRHCTPGATDPRVTPADIAATICRRGYTRTVRPPESVTEPEKLASMAAYGDQGSPRRFEYDHLIPLELGGAPNDPHNLWPEPAASPNPKDRLEDLLRRRVCAGRMSLRAAQTGIARDWHALWVRLGRP
jgi:hypothetical protein